MNQTRNNLIGGLTLRAQKFTRPGGIYSVGLICLIGLNGAANQARSQEADAAKPIDPAGLFKLVSVNGERLPASVLHGTATLKVNSGTFTITADGTCASKVLFVAPSGAEITREVNATYTLDGAQLKMKWEGAGQTVGTVEGDRFSMTNEGMIFAYEKQTESGSSDHQKVLDHFLGKWRSVESTGKDSETDLTYRRILGDRFVQELGKGADGKTAMLLYTYDENRQCYRLWSFRSSMEPAEATGSWDEATKTLSWTFIDMPDQETSFTATHRFQDDQTFFWDAVGKDQNGGVAFRTEGKATRVATP